MRKGWLCLLSTVLSAGTWDVTINSDVFAAWEEEPVLGEQGEGLFSGRLRLNADYDFSEFWQVRLAYEVFQFRRRELGTLGAPIWLRADDFELVLDESDNQALLHRLDRLQLKYEKNRWRVTLGRQAVGHGNGRFFNPSDIFAPLSPFSLNSQYKSGVDGLRIGRGVGELGEAELLVFLPEQGEGVYLGRFADSLGNVDFSLMAGRMYGETGAAWDFAGTFAGASWYSEGIWRRGDGRDNSVRVMAGFSRRISPGTDLTVETHVHNLKPDAPLEVQNIPEYRYGELFLFNEHHVALNLSRELHPLVIGSVTVLAETKDGSAWIQAGLGWDVSQRATLNAGYLHTRGKQGSEYGDSGDSAYMELRVTFP